jgi:RHS repeat-associated protein
VYDGDRLLLALDGGGHATDRFLNGPLVDQVLADEQQISSPSAAGTVNWLLQDQQQSVRAIAQFSGGATTIVDRIAYDSFGNVKSEEQPTVAHLIGYTGQVYDVETGLNYFKARYYDPHTGKFLSDDPAHSGSNPEVYANNNPISNTDPTG